MSCRLGVGTVCTGLTGLDFSGSIRLRSTVLRSEAPGTPPHNYSTAWKDPCAPGNSDIELRVSMRARGICSRHIPFFRSMIGVFISLPRSNLAAG